MRVGDFVLTIRRLYFNVLTFLPREAKRSQCRHAVSVHLSIRPSLTFVESIETNKHIFKFLVFLPTKRLGNITTGTPPPQRGRRVQMG